MNLMFQPQFEPLIVSGRKIHTIRPKRKVPLRPGQPLSLRVWTGKPYRSPQREFFTGKVEKVVPIVISHNTITLGDSVINASNEYEVAYHDGFESVAELRRWFINNHQLPFRGELIYWKP